MDVYTEQEKEFLKTKIMAVMSDAEDVRSDNTDIFAYNRSRDSSIAVSKRVIELLNKADRDRLYQRCIDDLCFMSGVYEALRSGKFTSAFQASGSESETGSPEVLVIFHFPAGSASLSEAKKTIGTKGISTLSLIRAETTYMNLNLLPAHFPKTPNA